MFSSSLIKLIRTASVPYISNKNYNPISVCWKSKRYWNSRRSYIRPFNLGPDKFYLYLVINDYVIIITNTEMRLHKSDIIIYSKPKLGDDIENLSDEDYFNYSLIYELPTADEVKKIRKYMCKNCKNTIVSLVVK